MTQEDDVDNVDDDTLIADTLSPEASDSSDSQVVI